MLALTTTSLGSGIQPITLAEAWPPRFPRPALPSPTRHLTPALDLAFGLEDESTFPEEIAALVARLRAGPLAQPSDSPILGCGG